MTSSLLFYVQIDGTRLAVEYTDRSRGGWVLADVLRRIPADDGSLVLVDVVPGDMVDAAIALVRLPGGLCWLDDEHTAIGVAGWPVSR